MPTTCIACLSLLLLDLLVVHTISGDGTPEKRIPLHIAGLFPLTGQSLIKDAHPPAAQLALDHINARPDILPEYELFMSINDSKCDPGIAMRAFVDQTVQLPTKQMVFISGCSILAEPVTQMSRHWNLLSVVVVQSPAFSNKKTYPYTFRNDIHDGAASEPKVQLMKEYGWTRVAIMYELQPIYSLAIKRMEAIMLSENIDVIARESFQVDPETHVNYLKEIDARIIVASCYQEYARRIFCEAYKLNMYGPRYVWMLVGWYSEKWWEVEDTNCTTEQLAIVAAYYISTQGLAFSHNSINATVNGKSMLDTVAEYDERTADHPGLKAKADWPLTYDSMWIIALTLHNASEYLKAGNTSARLEGFSYEDVKFREVYLYYMRQTNFLGVSGRVKFDEVQDRIGLIRIEQLIDGVEKTIGIYDQDTKVITWLYEDKIHFVGDIVPMSGPIIHHVDINVDKSLFAGLVAVACICICFAIGFLAINIKHKSNKIIKLSSPNINNLITVGAVICYMSVILLGIDLGFGISNAAYVVVSRATGWVITIGFTFAFGGLFVKTWRVHKVFSNRSHKKVVIKDKQLFALVGILLLGDLIILTVWTATDPMELITKSYPPQKLLEEDAVIYSSRTECRSPNQMYFQGAIYGIKGILLFYGAVLAFESRKVTVEALNDAKYIGLSIYTVVILCVIGIPVSIILQGQVDAGFLIASAILILATTTTLMLVFVPRLILLGQGEARIAAATTTSLHHQSSQLGTTGTTGPVDKHVITILRTELMEVQNQLDKLKDENDALKKNTGNTG